ncbi:hypothetical protein INR49_007182 [Caranx melampygus]|nr:hypothetical protein INR49_007182 [Caranx melampygus]
MVSMYTATGSTQPEQPLSRGSCPSGVCTSCLPCWRGKAVERILMPPPPPPFVAPSPVVRKRPRDAVTDDVTSLSGGGGGSGGASLGVHQDVCEKKSKVDEDASGLVPYGGDSSDEEEERTRSSKTDNS